MPYFNIVAQSNENTVVTEYKPVVKKAEAYQSEAELEKEFIHLLEEQGYEYLNIHNQDDLIKNLRKKLSELNSYEFTDNEWDRFFKECIANENEGIKEKSAKLQVDKTYQLLRRDDGSSKNIKLLDKDNVHANKLQVINQYAVSQAEGAVHDNRYDVTILVNGLPMVHVELKARGRHIREAFNQIERYKRESFWANSGLYEYIQIFVISNGTNTKYYSNTTRNNAVKAHSSSSKKTNTCNSFEFTSFWADAKNKIIPDLVDFTKTFFARHTILNILTKYCVYTSEDMLMVMRPYQITATERIINRIEVSNNYKKYGTIAAGGYIWHTTGSGKTLTSFKTAQLIKNLSYIDKVLFVVDRKDLDYQTMKEYDRFEKGCANSNRNTSILTKQLESDIIDKKLIITTIQKLSTFIKKNKDHPVYNKHVVIIFDECHRSQFGEMHQAIVKNFKKYHLFGFTGTPIFTDNATGKSNTLLFTTEQTFGDKLHSYTIVDAINDKNVLPFRVDYLKTMDISEDIKDEQVSDIDRQKAYENPKRIEKITEYILEHFNQKTYRRDSDSTYVFNQLTNIGEVASKNYGTVEEIKQKQRIKGFNSIFAVSSVKMAKLYYQEFQKQMKKDPTKRLKIATIYSYATNEEVADGLLDEENSEDTSALDKSSREFLESAIEDYNKMFHTNYSTDGDRFQNYYKDVSLRMKNKEIDMLIVVNMFLTGFDATTLNTLWVDKNLKKHGLLQAFSRTNRILNSIKTFGNIVCFRNLQKEVDDTMALFEDEKQTGGIVILHKFVDYYNGFNDENGKHIDGYVEMISKLISKFPLEEGRITGESKQKEFIMLFGAILRMRNLLLSFDEFEGKQIITDRDFQDYQSIYLDLKDELDKQRGKGKVKDIGEDVVFEIELIKQIDINIDYILLLVQKYHDAHGQDMEVLVTIKKAIDASPQLRSKKALIEDFIANINDVEDVLEEWQKYVLAKREEDLKEIIESEKLKELETRKFLDNAFRDGEIKTTGTDIDSLMPPMSRFGKSNLRAFTKLAIIEKLTDFFERYFGLGINKKFTDEENDES